MPAPQQNARFWLAQFSAEPLPDEADVSFARLIANAALLSRVAAALLKASAAGQASVPAVPLRAGEAWEAPAGAARAGRSADDAAAFVAACRQLGVRSVECCSPLDITHPGAASARAVRRMRAAQRSVQRSALISSVAAGVHHAACALRALQGHGPARSPFCRG